MYQVTVFIGDEVWIHTQLTARQAITIVGSALTLADNFKVRRHES